MNISYYIPQKNKTSNNRSFILLQFTIKVIFIAKNYLFPYP